MSVRLCEVELNMSIESSRKEVVWLKLGIGYERAQRGFRNVVPNGPVDPWMLVSCLSLVILNQAIGLVWLLAMLK